MIEKMDVKSFKLIDTLMSYEPIQEIFTFATISGASKYEEFIDNLIKIFYKIYNDNKADDWDVRTSLGELYLENGESFDKDVYEIGKEEAYDWGSTTEIFLRLDISKYEREIIIKNNFLFNDFYSLEKYRRCMRLIYALHHDCYQLNVLRIPGVQLGFKLIQQSIKARQPSSGWKPSIVPFN